MAETFSQTFEDILKDTVPQTPGIQRDVGLRELRLAAREFFEKSWAWTSVVEDVDAPADETDIIVTDGVSESEVIGILNVDKTEGPALRFMAARPDRTETSDDPQFWFINTPPDTIRLFPYLVNAKTAYLNITVALIPSFTATNLTDEVTTKFYDAIVNGYLSRVYLHPNKPYSAPALAAQLRHNFLRQIGYYMALRKSGGAGGQGWTYPPTWGVRRLGGNG